MIWPAAALAVLLLGFVIAYGSSLQSRLEKAISNGRAETAQPDIEL